HELTPQNISEILAQAEKGKETVEVAGEEVAVEKEVISEIEHEEENQAIHETEEAETGLRRGK
ncbi:MAG: hypothetical protein JSW41_02585, partial [Candidatus Aenigmatarchaeota archaeon]